jgi:hypothetical protein
MTSHLEEAEPIPDTSCLLNIHPTVGSTQRKVGVLNEPLSQTSRSWTVYLTLMFRTALRELLDTVTLAATLSP